MEGAEDGEVACVAVEEASEELLCGGLAGARRAEEAEDVAGADLKGAAMEGGVCGAGAAEVEFTGALFI